MHSSPVDKTFSELVAQDVRGFLPEDKQRELHTDENVDKVYEALVSLKRDVEAQLSNHKSRLIKKQHELNMLGDDGTMWKEYLAEPVDGRPSPADWRARAIKFLMAIEDHIGQVKARRRAMNNSGSSVHESGDIIKDLVDEIYSQRDNIDEETAAQLMKIARAEV